MFDHKQIIEIIATVFVSKFCSLLSPDDDSVFYSLGFFIGKQQFVHADGAGLAQESTSCGYNRYNHFCYIFMRSCVRACCITDDLTNSV